MEVQSNINNSNNGNKLSRNMGFTQIYSPNKEKPSSQRLRNSNSQNLEISKNEKDQITNKTDIYKSQFVNHINNDFNLVNSQRDKISQSGIENYSKKLSSSFRPKETHIFESLPSQNFPINNESIDNLINQNLYPDIIISKPKYLSQVISLPPQYIETVKEPLYLNSSTISESNLNKDIELKKSMISSNTINLEQTSNKSPQNQDEQINKDSINIYNINNSDGNNKKIDSVKILELKYVNSADNTSNDQLLNQVGTKVLPVKHLPTKVRPVKYIDSEQAKDIKNILIKGEDAQSNDNKLNIEGEERTQYCGVSDVLSKCIKKICDW
jgi:hypothetical protein